MTAQTKNDAEPIEYPDNDGMPMSDNTLQFRWIVVLKDNLEDLYRDDPNVFVAGDLLWYPVEGQPKIRSAPDAMVVFGRPKGYRGSYKQWEEGGVAPQVVFEVLSPGNRPEEMDRKWDFYDQYGVAEYYLYDPDSVELCGWRRQRKQLRPIFPRGGWTSPLLGIRFDLSGLEMVVYRPDGQPFLTFLELKERAEQAQREAAAAKRLAANAKRKATLAERKAEKAQLEMNEARQQAERLAAKLRELGIDPEA
jgi:Uma2 family endonuclease